MANSKDVSIFANVPFDWLSVEPYGKMTERDVAFLGGMFLSPSNGLSLTFGSSWGINNDQGGWTAMYELHIHGEDAISHVALSRLVWIIAKVAHEGAVDAYAEDLEDPSFGSEVIDPEYYPRWMAERKPDEEP